MLKYQDIQTLLGCPAKSPQNIIYLESGSDNQNSLPDLSNSDLREHCRNKKDIYVCTFCQVFSPHLATVTEHISTVHSKSLPAGTTAENFVSKLQPLLENSPKKKGKVGRPRKVPSESVTPVEQPIAQPVPDSNGLFWCKVCLRHFRKSRQLMQHICLDPEDEIFSEDSSIELDEDVEFRTHMDVDPVPWSRRKRVKGAKENSDSAVSTKESSVPNPVENVPENKVAPNWRNDPSYIPLFDDENEKIAFEEHLKSIDYSYVDQLFEVEEKRCRNKGKNNCLYVQSVIYSCKCCKKVFKSLSYIRLHCLTHTDIKPFTCPNCSYKSNSKGSLYMHMRMHTGNVFTCSSCGFKCFKRSHLLDHEATHTSVYQICKLCKNSYKTVRSLVSHIRKYHNNANGKKYAKSLTCKQIKQFNCDICHKKFKTLDILNNHNHACHETYPASDKTLVDKTLSEENPESLNSIIENIQINSSDVIQLSVRGVQVENKDPLAEIVLNNFLQHESEAMIYQNVFNHSSENILSPPDNLLDELQAADRLTAESSILEECQKTIDLDILNLQSTEFSNLLPDLSRNHSLKDNTNTCNSEGTADVNISEDTLEEPKSVEIKLFEKCQRAPAYVCCVCSAIYICTDTLKVHLQDHINSTNSTFINQPEEQYEEPAKITETSSELDVCEILQDPISSDEELQKLFKSSLDMMYYLPELSVVLENDPGLFDSELDDIRNFPISDTSPHDLNDKVTEDSVMKCFSGL